MHIEKGLFDVSYKENIEQVKTSFFSQIESINTEQELFSLKHKFLGKKSLVTDLLGQIKTISNEEKPIFGQAINQLKDFLENEFLKQEKILKAKSAQAKNEHEKYLDVTETLSGDRIDGKLHIYSQVIARIEEIFMSMGLQIFDGPEVETDFHNFGALNIPGDHPARDMYDTLWLNQPGHLLRTHTSTVQIRAIQKYGVPIAGIAPGRVFRHEATDATHDFMFTQCEGIVIDKNITLAHLFGVAKTFLSAFFQTKNLDIRIRPGFFPFVEPGVEIDFKCVFCKNGCSVCKKTTWIEVFPGGLVHPNVLKAVDVDSKIYSGFAFGFGIERMAMLLHAIDDVRLFHSGDMRFIRQI